MSQHYDEYEEFIRRALHAAADSVEPSEDGLERIRRRLGAPHSVPVAWVMAVRSGVSSGVRGGWDSVWAWLRTVPGPGYERWRGGTAGRAGGTWCGCAQPLL